jgi:CubicO group peptidase (beta-lactamase class C family)
VLRVFRTECVIWVTDHTTTRSESEVTMNSAHFIHSPHHPVLVATISFSILLSVQPGDAQTKRRISGTNGASDLGRQVDSCVQTAMSAYDIPGLSVAIVANGEIAYERGFGVKHRVNGGDVDEHTLFRHGSTNKMLTAAGILRLVDQGVIDLDDPVTEYVPELHFAPGRWKADQIQVRHLIANTGAIPSYRTLDGGTLSEWVSTLDEVPLLAQPGAFFNYSNSNFALADMVIERASGMAFKDYMAAEIYLPAGMHHSTRYASEAAASGNASFGHADDGTIYAPDDYSDMVDGFTSAHDFARWAQIMMNGGEEVLSRKSASTMQAPQISLLYRPGGPSSIDGGAYGFGLFVEDFPDGRVVRHGGGIPGWVAQVAWVPSEGFAVVLLANSWSEAFYGLEDAVECILDQAIGFTMPDMRELSDPRWWRYYAGTYAAVFEDGYEFDVVIEFKDGQLLMTAPNPSSPTQSITRALENVHASSFLFRPNSADFWEVTFVPEIGRRPVVKWLRNSRFVGYRSASPRAVGGRFGQ